ncbi:MAG TPA: hypothetical protein VIT83_02390 [Gammaproteobacteria bacterium]
MRLPIAIHATRFNLVEIGIRREVGDAEAALAEQGIVTYQWISYPAVSAL